ncbi:MAG: PDZ domain-containing protein [Pirellulales bacterium]
MSASIYSRLLALVGVICFSLTCSTATAQISLGGGGVSIGGPSGVGVGIGGGGVGVGIGGAGGLGVGIGPSGIGVGIGGAGGLGFGIGPGGMGINGLGGVGGFSANGVTFGGPRGLAVDSRGVGFGGARIIGRGSDGQLIVRAGALTTEQLQLGLNLGPTLNVLRSAHELPRGIRVGDVITAVDGRRVVSRADLVRALSERGPNEDVLVTVNRSGVTRDLLVRLGNTLSTVPGAATGPNLLDPALAIGGFDQPILAALGLTALRGLQIDGLDPTGAAAAGGLKVGDILLSLNGAGIADGGSLADALAAVGIGRPYELTVLRDGNPTTFVMQPVTSSDNIVGAVGSGAGTGVSTALTGDADAGAGTGLGTIVGRLPNGEHAAALGSGTGAGAIVNNTPVGDGGAGSGVGVGALLGGFPGENSNDGSAVGAGGGLGTVLNNTPVGDAGAGGGVGAGLLQTDVKTLLTPDNTTALGTGGGVGGALDNEKLGNLSGGAGAGLGALLGNVPTATQPGGTLGLGTGGGGGTLYQSSPVGDIGLGGGAGAGALLGGLGTPGGNAAQLTGVGTGGGLGAVVNNTPIGDVDAGTGVGVVHCSAVRLSMAKTSIRPWVSATA